MIDIMGDSLERPNAEKWQSGRMRRTRNPFYGSNRNEGSNPSFSAKNQCLIIINFLDLLHFQTLCALLCQIQ